uniref:Rad21_Rec8_N domain-containing protein n=1 Tax=Steinernema glaseri TaxID=37863 RepID=A0A1I8AQJ7_9BILA
MFTAYWTLNRRSPLARIWMAAHMEKKLTKAIVAEVNVNAAVEELRNTDERGGLRTTGYLLLGIVRIYAKKTGFLLTDAHDIVAMLKMAFAPSLEKIVLDEDSQIRRDPTPQPAEFPWELEYEEEESSGIRLADRRDITMQEEDFFAFDDRLQADVDMAQTVEALSRLATPSFAEPDQNFTSPVGAFDYIEQPTDIRQELARRRTLTQSPGMERRLQESATPIPEERVEFGETPICTPAALQGATPQQPSGIFQDSHVMETPQAGVGRFGEDESPAEGHDRDVTEISSAERKDLLGRIALGLAHQDQVSFSQYIRDEDSKRTVARKFFGLLEARKNREIKVHQLAPYAEIYIEADENLVRSS